MAWFDTWQKRLVGLLVTVSALWGAFQLVDDVLRAPSLANATKEHVQRHHHGDSVSASPAQIDAVDDEIHVIRATLDALIDTARAEQARRRERNARRDFLLCQALEIPPSRCNP